jgi:hypothetical protein
MRCEEVKPVVRCPFCGGELQAEPLKTWKFRFY